MKHINKMLRARIIPLKSTKHSVISEIVVYKILVPVVLYCANLGNIPDALGFPPFANSESAVLSFSYDQNVI